MSVTVTRTDGHESDSSETKSSEENGSEHREGYSNPSAKKLERKFKLFGPRMRPKLKRMECACLYQPKTSRT